MISQTNKKSTARANVVARLGSTTRQSMALVPAAAFILRAWVSGEAGSSAAVGAC